MRPCIAATKRRLLKYGAVLLCVGVIGVAMNAYPASAAVELGYYTATSTERSVLLEWGTVREFNLDGFKILCKDAAEPESEYHVIGSRIAQGGTESGADYTFEVTSEIVYGQSYCFRLEEVTTDDAPGEQFDRCGYGPGVPTAMNPDDQPSRTSLRIYLPMLASR